jgi:hypothetical protein
MSIAPRGPDAASLWFASLAVAELARRVYRVCRADRQYRIGAIIVLSSCARNLRNWRRGWLRGPLERLPLERSSRPAALAALAWPRPGGSVGPVKSRDGAHIMFNTG